MAPAVIAGESRTVRQPVVLPIHATLGAGSQPARILLLVQRFETGIVRGKLAVEIGHCEPQVLRNALFDFHTGSSSHIILRVSRGYLPVQDTKLEDLDCQVSLLVLAGIFCGISRGYFGAGGGSLTVFQEARGLGRAVVGGGWGESSEKPTIRPMGSTSDMVGVGPRMGFDGRG